MPVSSNIPFLESTSAIERQFLENIDRGDRRNVSLEEDLKKPTIVLGVYLGLMIVGATGNLAVLVAHFCNRRQGSGADLLMRHLAIADVFVTCIIIPIEIGWIYSTAWLDIHNCNLLCKTLMVIRAFGIYLSSNILVCISIDRFFRVKYPLRLLTARRIRARMPFAAWIIALCCSLPQAAVFRVLPSLYRTGFEQCVAFDPFSSVHLETAYTALNLIIIYLIPLLIMIVCCTSIFNKVVKSSIKNNEHRRPSRNGGGMRRFESSLRQNARRRTMWTSVITVCEFAFCGLPYAIITTWYAIDRESACRVDPVKRDLLLATGVINSCISPYIYGCRTFDLVGAIQRMLQKIFAGNPGSAVNNTNNMPLKPRTEPVKTVRTRPRANASQDEDSCECRESDDCYHEKTTV